MRRIPITFVLAAAIALVAVAGVQAESRPSLSISAAAGTIKRHVEAGGGTHVVVDACRRVRAWRVVCGIHVTRANGARELDRYIAFRGSSGRIGVKHWPIPPVMPV